MQPIQTAYTTHYIAMHTRTQWINLTLSNRIRVFRSFISIQPLCAMCPNTTATYISTVKRSERADASTLRTQSICWRYFCIDDYMISLHHLRIILMIVASHIVERVWFGLFMSLNAICSETRFRAGIAQYINLYIVSGTF